MADEIEEKQGVVNTLSTVASVKKASTRSNGIKSTNWQSWAISKVSPLKISLVPSANTAARARARIGLVRRMGISNWSCRQLSWCLDPSIILTNQIHELHLWYTCAFRIGYVHRKPHSGLRQLDNGGRLCDIRLPVHGRDCRVFTNSRWSIFQELSS